MIFVYFYIISQVFKKNFLIELQRNVTNAIWQHSFFIIVNNNSYKDFLKNNCISTDLIFPYGDTQTLLGWRVSCSRFHGSLESSELSFDADPNYDALIAKIKKILPKGYKEIPYDKAIKIAELNGYDVLNTNNELTVDLSDIIGLGNSLPSPITPENRFIKYKVVWKLDRDPSDIITLYDIKNNNKTCSYKIFNEYILFEQNFELNNQMSLFDNNQIYSQEFLNLIQEIEGKFNTMHVTFTRSSYFFWSKIYGVELLDEKGIYEKYKIKI